MYTDIVNTKSCTMNLKKLLVIKNGGKDMMKNVEKDVVLDEVEDKIKYEIISVEDFKNYFNERKIITLKEYECYIKIKDKNT